MYLLLLLYVVKHRHWFNILPVDEYGDKYDQYNEECDDNPSHHDRIVSSLPFQRHYICNQNRIE